MVRWTLTSLNLSLQKVYSNFISKNHMFQGSFSTSPCGSRSALLRYIMTPFAKAISVGPFLSNMCSLKHWISIDSTEKKNEAFEESEVSTFFIRRSHSFGNTCLHQSSNPKLVGQAAVLNRELDSVGSENSWQLSSWATQDLANNTVPLYLWVVPPSQFASHHDFYIVTESQIKPWFATSQHSGTRGSRSNLYSLLLWVDSLGLISKCSRVRVS